MLPLEQNGAGMVLLSYKLMNYDSFIMSKGEWNE